MYIRLPVDHVVAGHLHCKDVSQCLIDECQSEAGRSHGPHEVRQPDSDEPLHFSCHMHARVAMPGRYTTGESVVNMRIAASKH